MAIDALGGDFEEVLIGLMADFAVEAVWTEYLISGEGIFPLLGDPGLKALGVDELDAAGAAAWREQRVVVFLRAQTDPALGEGIVGRGCSNGDLLGLHLDYRGIGVLHLSRYLETIDEI
jgi:hypothetical protein